VEVQELTCKALFANVRFRLSPLFADSRGALIRRLSELLETNEYGWSDESIQVFTSDQRRQFRLSGHDLIGSWEHFEEFDAAAGKIRLFVEEALNALAVEQVAFLGVRSHWTAATDDFGGLRDALIDRFGGGGSQLSEVAGTRATDVGWVFEFRDKDPQITVRMGPMRSEQAVAQIFRVKDPELYAPDFLFLDVDRVISDQELPVERLSERLEKAIEHNRTLAGKFGRYFTSLENA
jgi:hypothetical protein